jgi:putative transcriptional regulator
MRSPAPGALLIARPSLSDPHFLRTVVFLLEHNAGGSLGLIINRPLDLRLGDLWETCPEPLRSSRACGEGGPVERHKGLLIHGYTDIPGAFDLGVGLAVGGEDEPLSRRLGQPRDDGLGPRLFLGHAGWGPGQLADEVAGDAWVVRRGHPSLVLDTEPADDLWQGLVGAGAEPVEPGLN